MRTLYHYPLSPFSRKVRIALAEKELEFSLELENFWKRRKEFLIINPAAQVPVLKETNGTVISDSTTIIEYLEEKYGNYSLIGKDTLKRAEARRIAAWFNNKFYYEVTKYIIDERVLKHLRNEGAPNCSALRAAKKNIVYHLDYIEFLLKKRSWLAGEDFSIAEISASAQISVLDYLGEIDWNKFPKVKEWYAIVKSRPSFSPILEDIVLGFNPPAHYPDSDF